VAAPKIWRFNGEVLAKRYWQPGMGERKLAAIYGCSRFTIHVALVTLGIPRRRPGGTRLEGRWSMLYDRCVACNSTERPHYGLGMCSRCYTLWRWRRNNPGRPRYVKRDYSEVAC